MVGTLPDAFASGRFAHPTHRAAVIHHYGARIHDAFRYSSLILQRATRKLREKFRRHRLRARFTKLATQFVSMLDADEQREIERFFRRAEVPLSLARPKQPLLKSGEQSVRGYVPPEKTNGKV